MNLSSTHPLINCVMIGKLKGYPAVQPKLDFLTQMKTVRQKMDANNIAQIAIKVACSSVLNLLCITSLSQRTWVRFIVYFCSIWLKRIEVIGVKTTASHTRSALVT